MSIGTDIAVDEVPCPSCDETWDDQQTMRIHHARAHDQRLVDLATCNHCGERFEPTSGSTGKYCSVECAAEDRNERFEKTCEECGEEFTVQPSASDQQFCSKDCYGDSLSTKQHFRCTGCGHWFKDYDSKGRNQFCSNACRHETRTERPRPDSLEMLAWLLYEYEDNTLWETYKRVNVVRDDNTTQKEVRVILEDIGVLGKSPADRIRRQVENGQLDINGRYR